MTTSHPARRYAALLLLAAPLFACASTESGGILHHGESFASVRLDFNT